MRGSGHRDCHRQRLSHGDSTKHGPRRTISRLSKLNANGVSVVSLGIRTVSCNKGPQVSYKCNNNRFRLVWCCLVLIMINAILQLSSITFLRIFNTLKFCYSNLRTSNVERNAHNHKEKPPDCQIASPVEVFTCLGLSWVWLSPCPSRPYSPRPQVKSSPDDKTAAVCELPQEISCTNLLLNASTSCGRS